MADWAGGCIHATRKTLPLLLGDRVMQEFARRDEICGLP
ncbi:hypothetical protein HHE02_02590 [Helicobacter heilmannii]|uniref:Uncharacterized protein n=1 Tax=Helicobacter heilmannii TaxID=35817 RepID=A0A0K2Y067_HELHE|nr:hypothetical protein BN341_960 [Helicobacter heilmannii ASB1.4]CRF45987.1 hypothetical protein HHE014_09720 [Helicobacter heilmannii]CRF46977.1 hypothetical protein HHE02_02590 [Helicobacter heilmannii]CRF51732.1 hypothetical protein HHE06_16310 [Helicobacter heilmannii]CRI33905.1 hypothetical protein HHE01_15910 [Helicobacter heilmannii]